MAACTRASIETLASIGAALVAMPRGQRVVGLENNTSFIRAVRAGKLHGDGAAGDARPHDRRSGKPGFATRRSKLVAQGRVRLLCVAEEPRSG